MIAPKVFLSHASEDKDRFVLDFALKLRENGVDVWLDQWEIKLGDSLVEKIFEEGLKEALAVIIVLSNASVQKSWVLEELNVSVVNKISRGTRLIPVVIDDCEVPESLRSTRWVRVNDLDDYNTSLQSILSAIFGLENKPMLGQPPARFSGPAPLILGLTRVDDLVFRTIAGIQIDGDSGLVEWGRLCSETAFEDIPQQELLDSLVILEQRSYIRIVRVIGAPLSHVVLTDYGFKHFAEAYVEGYQELVVRIAVLIVNENVSLNENLASRIDKTRSFVDFVLNLLESDGHIKVSKYMGGLSNVWEVSASLRRELHNA